MPGARCLLSDKPALAKFTVKYKGGEVYFCCESCREEFTDNPKEYAAQANHQLFLTGQAEAVLCPLTGRKLSSKFNVNISGADTPFCCGGCKAKALKAQGDKQIVLVFNDANFAKYFKVKQPANTRR